MFCHLKAHQCPLPGSLENALREVCTLQRPETISHITLNVVEGSKTNKNPLLPQPAFTFKNKTLEHWKPFTSSI